MPTVVALQLEVGLAVHLANREGEGVVLTQVVVCSVACDVICINSLVGVFLGDDVDDTCHRITSIQRTLCSLDNLNALDVVWVDESEVILSTHVAMYALAINEDENVRITQTSQLHLTAHIALAESKGSCESAQYIFDAFATIAIEGASRDDLCLYGHILQQVLGSSTCHNHFL